MTAARLEFFKDAEGTIWTPVIGADGRPYNETQIRALAEIEAPSRTVRRFKAILLTEDSLRDGQPGFNLSDGVFFWPNDCPVVFGADDIVVGTVERIANLTDDGLEWYAPINVDGIVQEPVLLNSAGEAIATITGAMPCKRHRVCATVRLLDTELSAIVFDGIRRGILDSVCGVFSTSNDEAGRAVRGGLHFVKIEGGGANCLAEARIIDWWEELSQ